MRMKTSLQLWERKNDKLNLKFLINRFENLEEMDTFQEKCKLPKLTQEKQESLKSSTYHRKDQKMNKDLLF